MPNQNNQPEDPIQITILNETPAVEPVASSDPLVPEEGHTTGRMGAAANQLKERGQAAAKAAAKSTGQAAAAAGKVALGAAASVTQKAAKKAWQSDARKKATRKMGEAATQAAVKSQDKLTKKVNEIVTERLEAEKQKLITTAKETDWREVAKLALAKGARALQKFVKDAADRLEEPNNKPKDPTDSQ